MLNKSFSIKSPNNLVRIDKRTYHTKVKLFNCAWWGVKNSCKSKFKKNKTYNDCTGALETSILIVKLSNDVSFPDNYTMGRQLKIGKSLKQSSKKLFNFWLIPIFLMCFINLAGWHWINQNFESWDKCFL